MQNIEQQIKDMGFGKLDLIGVNREIKYLPKILFENEQLKSFVPGMLLDKNGALVITDQRVIFISKSLFSTSVEDFPMNKISSVSHQTGLMFGEIMIFASGNRQIIKNIAKARAAQAADAIRNLISQN